MNGARVGVVITGANIGHGNCFNFIIIAGCTWLVKDTLWEWKEKVGEGRRGKRSEEEKETVKSFVFDWIYTWLWAKPSLKGLCTWPLCTCSIVLTRAGVFKWCFYWRTVCNNELRIKIRSDEHTDRMDKSGLETGNSASKVLKCWVPLHKNPFRSRSTVSF